MTNFEKYFDDLTTTGFGLLDGNPIYCYDIECAKCGFNGMDSCSTNRMEWLKAEYEEPKINIPEGTNIDTKVWVSENGEYWTKRHYAGFKQGKHYAWSVGKTSWTCEPDEISQWEYMKLYNEEEE